MAAADEDERQRLTLKYRIHYVVLMDQLILDLQTVFVLYRQYYSFTNRSTPPIESQMAFLALVKNEPYFISSERVLDGFAKGRECLVLSMQKLKEKGINSPSFAKTDEFSL